jgi:hypothetical protein
LFVADQALRLPKLFFEPAGITSAARQRKERQCQP